MGPGDVLTMLGLVGHPFSVQRSPPSKGLWFRAAVAADERKDGRTPTTARSEIKGPASGLNAAEENVYKTLTVGGGRSKHKKKRFAASYLA